MIQHKQRHSWWPFFLISLLLIQPTPSLHSFYPEDYGPPLTTVAFGSCNRQNLPQPHWPVILQTNPDLWIWGGDNIYGDSPEAEILHEKYQMLYNQADYRNFRETLPIIGTWDDHDYGENNSGKWFQSKVAAQKLALDFLDEPVASPRRLRQGIYASYTFGPPGRQVKVLLIDNRYHADLPGPNADLLGDEQWLWLENELRNSRARIQLIVSGIQFLQEEQRFEKWANFPNSRNRLLTFIRKNKIPGVVFLSGDRHLHEIAMKDDEETAYPLVEITSSGLTHSYSSYSDEPNNYRIREVFSEKGFGVIRFDWNDPIPCIHLQIRDMQNTIQRELSLPISQLAGSP